MPGEYANAVTRVCGLGHQAKRVDVGVADVFASK